MAVRPTDPEALHLYQLIGAPLLAVVQAEAQAAQVSADFIRRTGFMPSAAPMPAAAPDALAPDGADVADPASPAHVDDVGQLRIAEFQIDRHAADGSPRPVVARVPVLSMFPIPLLQVKHAEFEFDIRVLTRVPLEDPRPGDDDARLRVPSSTDYLSKDRVELKGFLSGARGGAGEKSTESTIKVRVRMEQSDLPAGISQLMTMMSESVSVVPRTLVEQTRDQTAGPR